MPELRRDPLSGRWVIVAPERGERPVPRRAPEPPAPPDGGCPFCAGSEAETPREVHAVRPEGSRPDDPDWRVRVVPNRYPAVLASGRADAVSRGLYRKRRAVGVHEVIVESPDHLGSLTELAADDLASVVRVYRDRLAAHRRRPDLEYALLFKNVGAEAGASIAHSHAQIIGTPILPAVIDREARAARRRWRERRRCILCETIHLEAKEGSRMVLATEPFIAFCPFASRFPLEVWVLPTSHATDFDLLEDALVTPLAAVLSDVLRRVEAEIGGPCYNLLLHTAPFRGRARESFHWHIEVLPRVEAAAGFEWGSGLHVNPLPPEEAAGRLRGDGGRSGAT